MVPSTVDTALAVTPIASEFQAVAVDRQAVFARQVTDAAAERKASDSGGWNDPPGRGKAKRLRFLIEVAPGGSAFGTCGPIALIDPNALHRR